MSAKPQIWVDADACPAAIKEVLFRAAERTGDGGPFHDVIADAELI